MIDRDEPALGQRIQLLGQVEREPIAFVSPAERSGEFDPGHHPARQRRCRRGAAGNTARRQSAASGGAAAAGAGADAVEHRHLSLRRRRVDRRCWMATSRPPRSACRRRSATCATARSSAHRHRGAAPLRPAAGHAGAGRGRHPALGLHPPRDRAYRLEHRQTRSPRWSRPFAAAAEDDAFREQAEANGYYAAWTDGTDWMTQMQAEQAALAKLWQTNPWLSSSGG